MSEAVDRGGPRRDGRALAWSEVPVVEHLAAWVVDYGDGTAFAEFAEGLAERRDELWERGREVASRELKLAGSSPTAAVEGVVAPAAVATFLRNRIVESGDDVATVATEVGVEAEWASAILTGEVDEVDPLQVQRMCRALDNTPNRLFGATGPVAELLPVSLNWAPSTSRQLVDVAGWLPAEELRAHVALLDGSDRSELFEALDQRHRALCRWSYALDVREERLERMVGSDQEVVPAAGELFETRFPAAPVVAHITNLVVDTGDDLDAIAHSLKMEPARVRDMVNGDIDYLDAREARRLCAGLDLEPTAVFGRGARGLDRGLAPEANSPSAYGPSGAHEAGRQGVVNRQRPEREDPHAVAIDPFINDPLYPAYAIDLPDLPDLDFGP
jgi:hypothetical protein